MSLRTAAQQALEALEDPWKVCPEGVADAIIALRTALAEPEQNDTALLRQGYLLCDEINKMPHVRGSINGMAVQLQYALRERLGEKT
jgi:hypothetical protein